VGEKVTDTYQIIEELSKKYTISLLCDVVKVSTSGFYKMGIEKTKRRIEYEKIKECHQSVKRIYGLSPSYCMAKENTT
jgi:putative transposase